MKAKKIIIIDDNAHKEIESLPRSVKTTFYSLFNDLAFEGRLEYPHAKKIDNNLFEIRIKVKGEYRGFYAYIGKLDVVILHFFRKKTQKTPIKDLDLAQKRFKASNNQVPVENGIYCSEVDGEVVVDPKSFTHPLEKDEK